MKLFFSFCLLFLVTNGIGASNFLNFVSKNKAYCFTLAAASGYIGFRCTGRPMINVISAEKNSNVQGGKSGLFMNVINAEEGATVTTDRQNDTQQNDNGDQEEDGETTNFWKKIPYKKHIPGALVGMCVGGLLAWWLRPETVSEKLPLSEQLPLQPIKLSGEARLTTSFEGAMLKISTTISGEGILNIYCQNPSTQIQIIDPKLYNNSVINLIPLKKE